MTLKEMMEKMAQEDRPYIEDGSERQSYKAGALAMAKLWAEKWREYRDIPTCLADEIYSKRAVNDLDAWTKEVLP